MTFFFTFGQGHRHVIGDKVFDKDTVLELKGTFDSTRNQMFALFGEKWSMQYENKPNMGLFPKGILKL